VQCDRGEARDEHDLERGIEIGRALGELDAVEARHHDVREQKIETYAAQALIGLGPIAARRDVVTRALERLSQEAAHRFIVFGK